MMDAQKVKKIVCYLFLVNYVFIIVYYEFLSSTSTCTEHKVSFKPLGPALCGEGGVAKWGMGAC